MKKIWKLTFVIAVLLVSITSSIMASAESYTPAAVLEYNDHIYKLYDASLTWENAKTACEELGGHLVTITSLEEQKQIEDLLNQGGEKKQYWIGLKTSSGYTWVTGETYSYSNWDTGEPNNNSRSDGAVEDYIHIYNTANPRVYGSQRFKWNDMFADNTYPGEEGNFSLSTVGFICEWDDVSDSVCMSVDSAVYADDGVKVHATVSGVLLSEDGVMIIALYEKDTLVSVHCTDIASNIEYNFNDVSRSDSYHVKMFCWSSLNDLVPLYNHATAIVQ